MVVENEILNVTWILNDTMIWMILLLSCMESVEDSVILEVEVVTEMMTRMRMLLVSMEMNENVVAENFDVEDVLEMMVVVVYRHVVVVLVAVVV